MKKIEYKLVNALAIAILVGLTSSLVYADDPAVNPAHPHTKADAKDAKKTTHVTESKTTHTTDVKHVDHPVAQAERPRPEVHDTTIRRDNRYTHDNQGWYDEGHHRHDFITYRGQRGYWDYANGQQVFIQIGQPVSIQIHI